MPAGLPRAGIVVSAPGNRRIRIPVTAGRDVCLDSWPIALPFAMFRSTVRAMRSDAKHACTYPATTFDIAVGRTASVHDGRSRGGKSLRSFCANRLVRCRIGLPIVGGS